jgi:hypothetical protein
MLKYLNSILHVKASISDEARSPFRKGGVVHQMFFQTHPLLSVFLKLYFLLHFLNSLTAFFQNPFLSYNEIP